VLKLTGLDILFAAAGNLYLLLALVGVCIALWKGKTWLRKGIYAVLVLAAFSAPLVPEVTRQIEFRNRQATAQSMFAERCKTAGEKIYKTVENVEGVYLMKLRPSEINYGDQFKMDDPYGRDFGGEAYFGAFLRGRYEAESKDIPTGAPPRYGYLYVEALDPKDGQRYRYTGGMKIVGKKDTTAPAIQFELQRNPNYDINNYAYVLNKILSTGQTPRYGVTYDDISTHEEREYWIAGSSLKVVDLQTKEVIAERIGYMVDWAQGSTAGQRSPWLFAADNACPDFYRNYENLVRAGRSNGAGGQTNQTLDFVEKVLKPSK
jgi:hypothetical protein